MSKLDAALVNRNQEAIKQASPLFDDLNKSWEKIEAFFRQKGILRPVVHCYAAIEDFESNKIGGECIGIEKMKGKWRICHGVEDYLRPPGEISWTPVSDCPTELRINLLEHVNDLFEKLVKSNEAYIPEIEQAVAKSHTVLDQLGIAKDK